MIIRSYEAGPFGQIHLRKAGKGSAHAPLLMLHPTPKSGWIYEPLLRVFGADRVALAPDTPGYGASDAPAEPGRMDDYVASMLQLLDALAARGEIAPGPVDVMGYHTGSAIAVAMAEAAPERVRKLVLVSLPALTEEQRAQRIAGLPSWPKPSEDGAHLTGMWDKVRSFLPDHTELEWTTQSVVENLRAGSRVTWGYEAVYRYDMLGALERVQHPTLVLNPGDDLYEITSQTHGRIPGGQVVELLDLKHGLFEFATNQVVSPIRAFLDGEPTA